MCTALLLVAPLVLGFIVMSIAGAGGKGPGIVVTDAGQAVAFQERIDKAYYSARDFGIKAVTGVVQACAITTVLVIGLFDRSGVIYAAKDIATSLILLVEALACGVLTTGLNYFGYYFEAHATVYGYGLGHNPKLNKLWNDRGNRCYDFALLFGVASGVAFLGGIFLLVKFWFEVTYTSLF